MNLSENILRYCILCVISILITLKNVRSTDLRDSNQILKFISTGLALKVIKGDASNDIYVVLLKEDIGLDTIRINNVLNEEYDLKQINDTLFKFSFNFDVKDSTRLIKKELILGIYENKLHVYCAYVALSTNETEVDNYKMSHHYYFKHLVLLLDSENLNAEFTAYMSTADFKDSILYCESKEGRNILYYDSLDRIFYDSTIILDGTYYFKENVELPHDEVGEVLIQHTKVKCITYSSNYIIAYYRGNWLTLTHLNNRVVIPFLGYLN